MYNKKKSFKEPGSKNEGGFPILKSKLFKVRLRILYKSKVPILLLTIEDPEIYQYYLFTN